MLTSVRRPDGGMPSGGGEPYHGKQARVIGPGQVTERLKETIDNRKQKNLPSWQGSFAVGLWSDWKSWVFSVFSDSDWLSCSACFIGIAHSVCFCTIENMP